MEIKVQLPFQQLLDIIKSLPFSEKALLRKELDKEQFNQKNEGDFLQYLLNGPVYNEEEIQTIEENRKSIAAWRTTN